MPISQVALAVEACPVGLDPSYLFKRVEHEHHDEAIAAGLLACIECGCCSYVCPSHIPLVQQFRIAKAVNRESAVKRSTEAATK